MSILEKKQVLTKQIGVFN